MKPLILSISFLLCAWLISAQNKATFIVVGNSINKEIVEKDGRLDISKIKVENITNDAIYLVWETISNTFPTEWDCSMCQHGKCQIGIPKGSEFKRLNADQQGFIAIHVMPRKRAGKGIVKFKIYDKNNPEHTEILTFEVDVR